MWGPGQATGVRGEERCGRAARCPEPQGYLAGLERAGQPPSHPGARREGNASPSHHPEDLLIFHLHVILNMEAGDGVVWTALVGHLNPTGRMGREAPDCGFSAATSHARAPAPCVEETAVPAARPQDSRPYAARAGSPLPISGRARGRGGPRPGWPGGRHTVRLHWEIQTWGFRRSNLLSPSGSGPNRKPKWVTRPPRQPLFGGL